MTTDNLCFYLQKRLIQTSQTGGQWYSDTPPLVFPAKAIGQGGMFHPIEKKLCFHLKYVDIFIL
jgi:hypothetical protein